MSICQYCSKGPLKDLHAHLKRDTRCIALQKADVKKRLADAEKVRMSDISLDEVLDACLQVSSYKDDYAEDSVRISGLEDDVISLRNVVHDLVHLLKRDLVTR